MANHERPDDMKPADKEPREVNAKGCDIYGEVLKFLTDMADGELPVECMACRELRSIRATLMVNYGTAYRNAYGMRIEDIGQRTERMAIDVLEKLTARIKALETALKPFAELDTEWLTKDPSLWTRFDIHHETILDARKALTTKISQ